MSDADFNQAMAGLDQLPTLTTLGLSPMESFSNAWDATKRNEAGDASLRNVAGAVQDHIDRVKSVTGNTFDNPIHSDFLADRTAQSKLANTTQALSELAQKRGDPSLAMPDLDALNQQGLEKARAAARLAEQQPGLIFSGKGGGPYQFGAGIAGFAGGLAATATDAETLMNNVGAMALVPAGGWAVVRALKTAAGFGAGQLATTIDTEAYKREITPDRGFGDAAKEVAAAAALGAGGELAGASVGALLRRLRTQAPSVAAAIPQPLQDAGNVAERTADLDANNPFRTGLTGATAHRDAISQLSLDVAAGKVPEVPAGAQAEAKVPTGQVFATTPDGVTAENEAGSNAPPYSSSANALRLRRVGEDTPPVPGMDMPNAMRTYAIDDMAGRDHGVVNVSYDASTRDVRIVSMDTRNLDQGFTRRHAKDLLDDLRQDYPFAESVSGLRVTGARIESRQEVTVPIAPRVFLGNRAVDVKYELAEARDLITSHDRDFMVNPNYPAELQPRARANVASRSQVIDMAANLEPERLGPSPEANAGAPLVGPDNVVESGNGRAMAIRSAYDAGSDRSGAYRAFLERSGFDTSQTNEPVLIARRTTNMRPDERAAFAQSANASTALRMSTMEQALSDARHIGPDITPLLQPGDMGSAANRDFAKAFVAKLPIGERGGMLTQGGQLSAAGVQRLRAASVARAYGDAALVARAFEHPDSNIKTIAGSLSDAAPEWIRLKQGIAHGEIPSTHDITPDLMNAVKAIMQARDMGRPVHELLNQGDFFHSDASGLAARMFFKDAGMTKFLSRADMAGNISSFARDIRTSAEAGPGLFGQEPITPKEALAARVPRATPEEAEKMLAEPSFHDAMIADLQRDIDRGDAHIGVTDEGKPILADAEFHAAEQKEMLAKEIGNCLTGGAGAAE